MPPDEYGVRTPDELLREVRGRAAAIRRHRRLMIGVPVALAIVVASASLTAAVSGSTPKRSVLHIANQPTSTVPPSTVSPPTTSPPTGATVCVSNPIEPGYCAPPGAAATISNTKLAVGDQVTLTGNDCPAGTSVHTVFGQTPPGPDGRWTLTATVTPDLYTYAPRQIVVFCTNVFFYPQVFTVTVTTPYRLGVTPAGPVAPGTTITVRPLRALCSVGQVLAAIGPTPTGSLVPDMVSQSWPVPVHAFPVPPDGLWAASLQLPSTVPKGTYWVIAGCVASRASPTLFQPAPIQIG